MRGFKWTRESFIPKGAIKVTDKKSDAVAYVANSPRADGSTRFHVVAFCANRQKPDINATYRNEPYMQSQIAEFFASRQRSVAYKAEKKAKAEAPIKLTVGTILTGSWGYDQTNREFWQVVGFAGNKSVKLRPVQMIDVSKSDSGAAMAGQFIPHVGNFVGTEVVTKLVTDGNRVRLNKYCTLRPWEGKPEYASWYA